MSVLLWPWSGVFTEFGDTKLKSRHAKEAMIEKEEPRKDGVREVPKSETGLMQLG